MDYKMILTFILDMLSASVVTAVPHLICNSCSSSYLQFLHSSSFPLVFPWFSLDWTVLFSIHAFTHRFMQPLSDFTVVLGSYSHFSDFIYWHGTIPKQSNLFAMWSSLLFNSQTSFTLVMRVLLKGCAYYWTSFIFLFFL